MAQFTIKIVDHTNSSDGLKGRIQSQLQGLFDEVFANTNDSATVSWGTGAASDNAVTLSMTSVPLTSMPNGRAQRSGRTPAATPELAARSPVQNSTNMT